MDRDWVRLGKALKASRMAKQLKQDELADLIGVSRSTVQAIERGKPFDKITPTHRAFARVVDWSDTSPDDVLGGEEPALMPAAEVPELDQAQPVPIRKNALPLRIVDEIENDGALVDTAVIPLGDGGNMVVVVKGRPNASPDEIQKNLETWRRAQRHLQSLDGTGGNEPTIANEA